MCRQANQTGTLCAGLMARRLTAFHLAVSDTDMKRDTKTNTHVRARLIDSQYKSWGAVALDIGAQDSASLDIQASVCLPSEKDHTLASSRE